jgi:xanthine dehydrogenase accessory factor
MPTLFKALAELEEKGQAGVLCTIIETSGSAPRHETSKMLVYPDGHIIGTVGGGEIENRVINEALQSLKEGASKVLKYKMVDPKEGDPGICGGQVEVFVEPILPQPLMILIGGGHVGKCVAHLAHWLGFRVVVSDDRPEFCTPDQNPDADMFLPVPMSEITNHIEITPYTYIVLTTRGVSVDVPGLPPLLKSSAAYIGVIGSKRRWIMTRKGLVEMGVSEEVLDQVHSPIGLELNAETPEEIAVSIMAEIIMLRKGGTGKSMKI